MENKRFLHCEEVYTDTASNMNDVRRLSDGRLFTVGIVGKITQSGTYCTAPSDQFVFGRVSSDEGKSWQVTFFRQLPESTALTLLGDFIVDKSGYIHIFFVHIYSMDAAFRDSNAYHGDITYARLEDICGNGFIYKKIEALDRYTGSMNCVLQLESGRIIAPFSTISHEAGSAFVSSVVYSDDNGETWLASNDVKVVSNESNIESGAVEPVVVEVANGVLVMLIRTVLNRLYYAVSRDEGATWTQAMPTNIPSSNAPAAVVRMPDGRIFITWNNTLGYPMHGVRYSFARQCLHAAVSDDGLKTIKGLRAVMRKRSIDPDNVLNCYPFCTVASDTDVFVRPFSVQDGEGAMWMQPQAHLLRMNLDDLLASEIKDSFDEWITDCEVSENGILMQPAVSGVAYACVNFPYAQEGRMTLATNGKLPANLRLILSDSYIDRATFISENIGGDYEEYLKDIYTEIYPNGGGDITVEWNENEITLTCGDSEKIRYVNAHGHGFNHIAVVYEGTDEKFEINGFDMSGKGSMNTGIEY